MKKRLLAGILWFYAAWYGWSVVASFVGVADTAGPILGLVAAVLFAGDPLGRIWSMRRDPATIATPTVPSFAQPT
jgi:hypothetical protein